MKKLIVAIVVLSSCNTTTTEFTPEEIQNTKELDSMQQKLDSIQHVKDSLGYGR
jgi:hypothetical protein